MATRHDYDDPVGYFARISEDYRDAVAGGKHDYHGRRLRRFNELVPRRPGLRVFDFGCGSAENVVSLAALGHSVTGIDPAAPLIALGRQNLQAARLDPGAISVGDVSALREIADRSIDVLTAAAVVWYLTEDEEATFYREARRIVADDGCIVVDNVNRLVDLVTFNRYTVQFWQENVIPAMTDDAAERAVLLAEFRSHITHPDQPARDDADVSEEDLVRRRKKDPISYPKEMARFGLRVEAVRFTNFLPMHPQFIERSPRFAKCKETFEERMQDSPLAYVFASMFASRLVKTA